MAAASPIAAVMKTSGIELLVTEQYQQKDQALNRRCELAGKARLERSYRANFAEEDQGDMN